ncbi:MAG: ATP-binding cassette domain-containing protein [Propioniciclava sp.]
MSLVEVHQLRRVYRSPHGEVTALDGVDITVEPGQRLGIVGESGSGKSTLVRLMAGLDRPTAGSVRFAGQVITGVPERRLGFLRAGVQLVFQDPRSSLNPRMRVGSIIAEPLRSRIVSAARQPVPQRQRVAELLAAVGLDPDAGSRYPHEFSGGQRQRIAIARALAPAPEVLIADEPVSALDVSVRAQVLNLLTDLVERFGLTLVFVSHDLSVVRHMCPDVIVMHQGAIVDAGPTVRLFDAPQHPYTARLVAAVPRLPARPEPDAG